MMQPTDAEDRAARVRCAEILNARTQESLHYDQELDCAVSQLLTSAQMAFTTSDALPDIKQSTDALREMFRRWREHDKRVESTVVGLIRLVQSRCKHVGARTGHNERDGSWMAPCPTCGDSR